MQVTETLNEGLRRELKVVVPAPQLAARLSEKLVDLSKTANIRGFRPGKVPVTHLRKVYGKSVMAEVLQEAVDTSSREALSQQNLKPAYQPEIGLPQDQSEVNAIIEGKQDLAYTMRFEVVPPIELKDTSDLSFERLVTEVREEDIDTAMERLRQQQRRFAPRPEGAGAETGDRLTISFAGTVDGKPFEGGTSEGVEVVLGSGHLIPGFEDQLVGATAGSERTVELAFPADYAVAGLAGKPAVFKVEVTAVEAPVDTPFDDDFAKLMGFDDLAALRKRARDRVAEEFAGMASVKLKRDVLDALDKLYHFELPEKLVEAEFNQIWQALMRELERENKTLADEGTSEEEARREYRAIAERRVRLGLVLGTIGEKAGTAVTEDELKQALIQRAMQFPGQERQVYEFFRKNPQAMMELRGPIFEQKVVDHIIANASVSERKVTPEELRRAVEEEHEHAHEHEHGHEHAHEDEHGHEHVAEAAPEGEAAEVKAAKPKKPAARKKPAAKKAKKVDEPAGD